MKTEGINRPENSQEIEDIACEMYRIFKEQPSEWLNEKRGDTGDSSCELL